MVEDQRRSPVLLVVCAAVGLGVLVVVQFGVVAQLYLFGVDRAEWVAYVQAAVLVLALVAWHLESLSWGVLVALGALCTVPTQVLLLWPDLFGDWMSVPYLAVNAASGPLLLVGLLGVATAVWRMGQHSAGAVLFGVTVVLPGIGGLIVPTAVRDLGFMTTGLPVIGLVLAVVAVAVTIAAAVTAPRAVDAGGRPTWQVTAAGAVAGATPVVYLLWPPPDINVTRDLTDYTNYFLLVGLVLLGIGLLAGAVAGPRVLVTGVAAGLLLGAVSLLAGHAATSIGALPGPFAAVVGLAALAAGVAVALPRARAVLGVAGLGVAILGLVVLSLMFTDRVFQDVGAVRAFTTTLAAVTIVSGAAVFASLGTVVAAAGEAPAAFAGVAAAIAGGAGGVANYFSNFMSSGGFRFAETNYPPVPVFLVLAAALTVVAHRLWQRTPPRAAEPVPEPIA
jgi:hypothetical protein